ncbi:unannotated protein [freshwater metagenome]|uniref:Unannotated protein n=1 Tax=freshwater metagenome TaxID=449393 RepID=A0A6J6AH14_9ZZZZ
MPSWFYQDQEDQQAKCDRPLDLVALQLREQCRDVLLVRVGRQSRRAIEDANRFRLPLHDLMQEWVQGIHPARRAPNSASASRNIVSESDAVPSKRIVSRISSWPYPSAVRASRTSAALD